MPLEGVVHALRNVHEALVPSGILLDLHPIPPAEQAEADGRVAIPRRLARRIRATVPPVWLRERVVLRRYRASGGF